MRGRSARNGRVGATSRRLVEHAMRSPSRRRAFAPPRPLLDLDRADDDLSVFQVAADVGAEMIVLLRLLERGRGELVAFGVELHELAVDEGTEAAFLSA